MRTPRAGLMAATILIVMGISNFGWAADTRVYRGRWQSQSTGHSGPMRVRLIPQVDGSYKARFSGRFLLVVPFTYKVSMQAQPNYAGGQHLSANKQLGPLLGGYSMSAVMDSSTLSGSFNAAGDTGQVHMRRMR